MKTVPRDFACPRRRDDIKESILSWIGEAELQQGDRILGQARLATLLDTTPLTVHRALTELSEQGMVYRRRGSGTFVGMDPSATALHAVGLVLPAEHLDQPQYNPHYWPVIQSMLRAFMDAAGDTWRFSTQVVRPDVPVAKAVGQLQGLDAVFFHHSRQPVDLWRHLVAEQIVPTVAFGPADPSVPGLTVGEDDTARIGLALKFLVGRGYRRIVPVCSRHPWGDVWLQHYHEALQQTGRGSADGCVLRIGEETDDAAREITRLQNEYRECDALLVDADLHALHMMQSLQAAGIRVPEDIGVMGLRGMDIAMHHPPHLTVVANTYAEMIRFALREIEKAKGAPLPNLHVDFVGEIVPGKTTRNVSGERKRRGECV